VRTRDHTTRGRAGRPTERRAQAHTSKNSRDGESSARESAETGTGSPADYRRRDGRPKKGAGPRSRRRQ